MCDDLLGHCSRGFHRPWTLHWWSLVTSGVTLSLQGRRLGCLPHSRICGLRPVVFAMSGSVVCSSADPCESARCCPGSRPVCCSCCGLSHFYGHVFCPLGCFLFPFVAVPSFPWASPRSRMVPTPAACGSRSCHLSGTPGPVACLLGLFYLFELALFAVGEFSLLFFVAAVAELLDVAFEGSVACPCAGFHLERLYVLP